MMKSSQAIKIETFTAPHQENRIRLSDFSAGIFQTIPTRKGMKKAIRKGLVTINGKTAYTGDYICGGELIELYQNEECQSKPTIDIEVEVLYEDEYLAIVNKPPGIEVSGNRKWTLENALPGNLQESQQPSALYRAEAIHRLDYPTSGALLIGKTRLVVIALNKMFESREVSKTYMAVTIGEMPPKGSVSFPVDGKNAASDFEVLRTVASPKYGQFNLVKLTLHTGRRHQLRIHMAHLGNPILGDLTYGTEGLLLKGKGLYLHSSTLSFIHPISNELITAEAPLPKKYLKLFL